MKINLINHLPVAFFILLHLSCSGNKQSLDSEVKAEETTFPYKLDSIPEEWISHRNEYYDFHLPPDWRFAKRSTLDSFILEIISPDSTTALVYDDLGFGRQPAHLMNTGWPKEIVDIDTLSGEGQLYYNLENRVACLILYDSYWISTMDSLTATQFEMACKILQTVKLRDRVFSHHYFESHRNGEFYQKPDPFREQIDDATTSMFLEWGFKLEKESTLDKLSDFEQHWWLKIFKKERSEDTSNFPKSKDWKTIKSIRQFTFKKKWQVVIEEWQLKDEQAARSWLNIAVRTQRLDGQKPPREYWIEGDKIYFVMTTTAHDWFEYGGELIEFFSGRSPRFLNLFNRPFDLKAYKKGNGANSGSRNGKPYLIKPDTVGTYYEYFWFYKLRARYPVQQSFDGLIIGTYIYGEEVGQYDKVDEELIYLKSKLEDPRLKHQLNLVGKSKVYLINQLGMNYLKFKDLIIYQYNRDLLILHISEDKIDWFNYVRTNLKLESGTDLPEELKYYSERASPNKR